MQLFSIYRKHKIVSNDLKQVLMFTYENIVNLILLILVFVMHFCCITNSTNFNLQKVSSRITSNLILLFYFPNIGGIGIITESITFSTCGY